MNPIFFAIHMIIGLIAFLAGFLVLAAGIDYFVVGVELFSEPGKMVLWGLGAFIVCGVVAIINFLAFMRDM